MKRVFSILVLVAHSCLGYEIFFCGFDNVNQTVSIGGFETGKVYRVVQYSSLISQQIIHDQIFIPSVTNLFAVVPQVQIQGEYRFFPAHWGDSIDPASTNKVWVPDSYVFVQTNDSSGFIRAFIVEDYIPPVSLFESLYVRSRFFSDVLATFVGCFLSFAVFRLIFRWVCHWGNNCI